MHDGLPHIADSIVDNITDLGTLVALRATSRAFRERVDPLLFAHVELHTLAPVPGWVTRIWAALRATSTGFREHVYPWLFTAAVDYTGTPPVPAWYEIVRLPMVVVELVRPPLVMVLPKNSTRVTSDSDFPVLPFCPSAVKRLDVVTLRELNLADTWAFPSLHTLRILHAYTLKSLDPPRDPLLEPSLTLQPHTLVKHYTFGVGRASETTMWSNHKRPKEAMFFYHPPGLERLVVNVSFPQDRSHAPLGGTFEPHLHFASDPPGPVARQVVVVFDLGRQAARQRWPLDVAVWLMGTLLHARMDLNYDWPCITVVGLDALLLTDDNMPVAKWFDWNADDITDLSPTHWCRCYQRSDPFVQRLLNRCRFLSHAEWHAEMGDRLDTEAPLTQARSLPSVGLRH